jgi:hypothetical protein
VGDGVHLNFSFQRGYAGRIRLPANLDAGFRMRLGQDIALGRPDGAPRRGDPSRSQVGRKVRISSQP